MKVSKRGLAEIAAHEGIVMSKYKDSVGVWTIGIGHTANAGHPNPIDIKGELSLEEVMDIFARDVAKFERRVEKAFKRNLTQSQFDAAVSFDFNTGGIHRATWVKKFNAGDAKGARRSFMAWCKPSEIIPRRQKERDLFFDGTYSGNGSVNAYPASKSGKVLWGQGRRLKLPTDDAPLMGADLDVPPKEILAEKPITNNGLLAAAVVAIGAAIISFWDAIVGVFQ